MAWDLHVHGLAAVPLSQWNEAFEETAKYITKRLRSEGALEVRRKVKQWMCGHDV